MDSSQTVTTSVPDPSLRPDYTLKENASPDEMRQMAIEAMRDMLTIRFFLTEDIKYNKTGAVSHKDYIYEKKSVYAGLPYADGQTNIFVWHEFYDENTGLLRLKGDGQWLNSLLGNTCAGSLMWAWNAVCSTLTGTFVNFNMTLKNGCIPVGNYKYDTSISSFKEQSTAAICKINSQDAIYESYALVKPADALTYSIPPAGHTMMVLDNAHVVRFSDGTIDPENSYVEIQDQTSGNGEKFYELIEDGISVHYTGRLRQKYTFKALYEKNYIPCTTAEFLGIQPYADATVYASPNLDVYNSINALMESTVHSNYPMCILKVNAVNEDNKTNNLLTLYFNRNDVGSGKARSCALGDYQTVIQQNVDALPAGKYTVNLNVTVSTGGSFTPISFTWTKG